MKTLQAQLAVALRGACIAVLMLLFSSAAWPHKPSDSYLTLSVQGRQIDVRWDVHLRDLDSEIGLDTNDDGQLSWAEVKAGWPAIASMVWPRLQLDDPGAHCTPLAASGAPALDAHSDGHYAVLTRQWQCERTPQSLRVGYTLLAAADPSHRGIVRVMQGGREAGTAVLGGTQSEHRFALTPSAPHETLMGFVREGVHHIASGTDHIAFLLTLLLPAVLTRRRDHQTATWQPATAWRPVLTDVVRVVTAFTVAHSLTLTLAVLGVFDPPSRWIESLIALSVLLAALNNLRPVVQESRWLLTFLFGLVHGFGFAGALKDLGLQAGSLAWPLLGFNLGVELGQLAIVAAFVPLAWALRATRGYQWLGLSAGSVAIALLAVVWLIERAGDVSILPGG